MKRALMIAFHFPPWQGSSGVQRTLKFCKYLPNHGWEPVVLTAHPRAYGRISHDQVQEILETTIVQRAFALDVTRHLAIRGSYPGFLGLPDRWSSWWFGALFSGLQLIRKYQPSVLWSTYPIATAHLIGLTLKRLSGVPWVADFRDAMVDAEFPAERVTRHVYLWIERASILRCNQAVLTTSGSKQLYETRYANVPPERWQIIANGYDEDNFVAAEKAISAITSRKTSGRIVLVHSGLLYPSERDPTAFFCALRDLLEAGDISPGNLAIVLRDSGNEEYYARLIHEHGIECIVSLEPAISYSEALMEMLNADGLLILQASNCNHLIPAKAYEYLRARRPILALTDPLGDTATLLRKVGVDTIAPLNSSIKIATGLRDFLARVRNGSAPVANDAEIATHSREARTKALAQLFDRITSARQEISPAR